MAATYVNIKRSEFEEWLNSLRHQWTKAPGREGVYLVHLSPAVAVKIHSSIGSAGTGMGKGKGAMHMALVSLENGRKLNGKALEKSRFNRTINWRENLRRGFETFRGVYNESEGFYERLAVIDMKLYVSNWLAIIETFPKWQDNPLLQNCHRTLEKGRLLTERQESAILKMRDGLLGRMRNLYRVVRDAGNEAATQLAQRLGIKLRTEGMLDREEADALAKLFAAGANMGRTAAPKGSLPMMDLATLLRPLVNSVSDRVTRDDMLDELVEAVEEGLDSALDPTKLAEVLGNPQMNGSQSYEASLPPRSPLGLGYSFRITYPESVTLEGYYTCNPPDLVGAAKRLFAEHELIADIAAIKKDVGDIDYARLLLGRLHEDSGLPEQFDRLPRELKQRLQDSVEAAVEQEESSAYSYEKERVELNEYPAVHTEFTYWDPKYQFKVEGRGEQYVVHVVMNVDLILRSWAL